MKQSSVLLHSKVKRVLYKGSLITLFFHIHQLCTIWQSKVYHSTFTVHSLVWVFSEKRQIWSSLNDIWIVFSFFLFLQRENKNKNGWICLWDKAFPNCAYTVDRETTKFPDMLSSAEVCAQLRGGAAKRGRQFLSFIIAIFTSCVKLDYIMDYYTLCKICLAMHMNMKRLPRGIQIKAFNKMHYM